MAVRFGEIPFQASDGRWFWNWTDPDGIAWPKGPFETKELALADIGKSKTRIAETAMTTQRIPADYHGHRPITKEATSSWETTNDLDRMIAVLNQPPTTADIAKVDQLIELVRDTGYTLNEATYSAKLNAGIDAGHDYTTGLIEISLAELQAFRAILALRRSGS